jgi:hypothetical protein
VQYVEFVQAGRGEGYRDVFHGGGKCQRVLGNDRFIEKEVFQPYKRKQIPFDNLIGGDAKNID